ncbi:hypothetical protein QR680_015667 [Steinernema hermaphroditum]|uniref:G-protein coupled receptors family 1 profile domain-containing protein n=1 Tax=Steinernema hermaphroditum TaxID=289476 RepID=A0AA39HB64_9BILA|nr:hypothetical protein QR680_015667 [Steinernema hermaphroditum]
MKPRLKSSVLVGLLASGDLFCIVSEWQNATRMITGVQSYRFECFWAISPYLFMIKMQTTIMCAMAFDRLFAFTFPLKYAKIRVTNYVIACCIPGIVSGTFFIAYGASNLTHKPIPACNPPLAYGDHVGSVWNIWSVAINILTFVFSVTALIAMILKGMRAFELTAILIYVIGAIGAFGNANILVAIWRIKPRSKSGVLVGILALADLISITFEWQNATRMITGVQVHRIQCFWMISPYLFMIKMQTTIMCAMVFDRLLALTVPLRYTKFRFHRYIVFCCIPGLISGTFFITYAAFNLENEPIVACNPPLAYGPAVANIWNICIWQMRKKRRNNSNHQRESTEKNGNAGDNHQRYQNTAVLIEDTLVHEPYFPVDITKEQKSRSQCNECYHYCKGKKEQNKHVLLQTVAALANLCFTVDCFSTII